MKKNPDDHNRQPRRLRATSASLEKAKKVAERLGIGMDAKATAALAEDLLGTYYRDATRVLDLKGPLPAFENFLTGRIEAFAVLDEEAVVFMDQQIDLWLLDLNQLLTVFACVKMDDAALQGLGELFDAQVASLSDPQAGFSRRELMWPYMMDYADFLPLANSMTKTMSIFMMCHELAHHTCGHLELDESKSQELEADQIAYQYLLELSRSSKSAETAGIDEQCLAAPCILMGYFDLWDRRCAMKAGLTTTPEPERHPRSSVRRDAMVNMYRRCWTEKAAYVYDNFSGALEELASGMGLRNIT